ncbi:MAG: MFS transporter [Leptolyngbyaceae cyanobacterium MO_188.B28]|nr:MFS transporter [Leptolyngbyaceae cyanobacterium MO_188.B28]
MKIFTQFTPALRFNLIALFAAGLCFWAGLAAFLPVLPLYIESLGANSQQIGLVMGSFAIGLLAARPRLAQMSDLRGRKRVLLMGMSAIVAAPIGYLAVQSLPPISLEGVFWGQAWRVDLAILLMMALRALHGISIAAFATAYSALVVDISPPQNRGELIGYMSLVNPLGLALGPALGGYLEESFGFVLVFLTAIGLGTVGLICTSQVREAQRPASQSDSAAAVKSLFWRPLWTPRIRIPFLMLLIVGLAFGSLSTFVPLYIRQLGVDLNVGLVYTAAAFSSFGIRLITGRASDRHGRGRFITFSLVFYMLAMGMLWTAHSAPMFLFAGFLQGAGSGTLIPMIAALIADRSQPDERGRLFGLCMVGFDVGIALAGPILGLMADAIGYRAIFGFSGLMICLGVLIFITASSKDVPHSLRFALRHGRDVYAIEPAIKPH